MLSLIKTKLSAYKILCISRFLAYSVITCTVIATKSDKQCFQIPASAFPQQSFKMSPIHIKFPQTKVQVQII